VLGAKSQGGGLSPLLWGSSGALDAQAGQRGAPHAHWRAGAPGDDLVTGTPPPQELMVESMLENLLNI
jgi:hypothetical protein